MKTESNRIFRFKTAKRLTSGARLAVPGMPRRRHRASEPQAATTPVVTDIAPPPVAPEELPGESLAGEPIQLYLREIGRVNLLTPQEEIVLARRIKRRDKAAREHMIQANLRLVVKIAREYGGLGLPLLDLINEGNIGLMKAVDRFDPRKGAKFSTYAALWIKQSIRRALTNSSKTVRLPAHVVDKVAQIRKSETRLQEVLDRDPTDEEIAEDMKLDARRVRRYREAARAPVSLDAPIDDEGSTSMSELVADGGAAAPFDHLVNATDNEMVREVLGTLNAREGKILTMRYGLDDDRPKTLEELGKHFGLTRERIRQIQEKALQQMRQLIEERDQMPSSASLEFST